MREYDYGYAEGLETGTQDIHKWIRRYERVRKAAAILLSHVENSADLKGDYPQWLLDCRRDIGGCCKEIEK